MLAPDETDLLLLPPLRAGWSKRGEVARGWLSGRNARRVVFGAMNLRTGARVFVPREKGRSADFQALVREVRSAYRGWHVALVLDEDPCHTAKASLGAVEGMTLALAQELPRGMAAVPLNPGVIDTDMLRQAWADGASAYPKADQWAKKAAPFLLGLGPKHNGRSLSVE